MNPRFVGLYAGAGGLDLGAVRAGFTPVLCSDLDADACATHDRLLGGPNRATCSDVASLDLTGLGHVDLMVAGPPCQGFSQAGRMDPDDSRSKQVWRYLDAVATVRPVAWVMENVANLASPRWAPVLDRIRENADQLGYDTVTWVLDAADYGVAQHRRRLFLVGLPRGVVAHPPPPSGRRLSTRDVLAELPAFGTAGNDTIVSARIVPARRPVLRPSPYAGMLFNGGGRPIHLDRPCPTLPASMGGNRTPIVDQAWLDHRSVPWVDGYHAHLAKGGSPVAETPSRLRRLTLEEAAALQGFPHGATFSGPLAARWRQVGNAVPPPLAEAVVAAVRGSVGM